VSASTEQILTESEMDNLLALGWKLSASIWFADGNHVILVRGGESLSAIVTGGAS